ncbi:MAG: DUF4407 domain-containing protein [Salinivirgaceae bacterium]|jgi:hypothetical protein|nr:DUF4407 domain-containing protein [Salinivirgaceae bacterium]
MSLPKEWNGSAVARFFLWCSGARIYLLKKCPTEINIFLGIGIVVFLTGSMAALSGGYAFYTVFQSVVLAVVFGLFWGILIFFMDWYLVASLRKEQNGWREFGMALPRIILALFIAVVVARPIEMKLFEKEIDLQIHKKQLALQQEQREEVSGQFIEIQTIQAENDSLQTSIQKLQERRNQLYNQVIAEAEGRSPVGVVGKGPVYREKQQEYKKASDELERAEQRLLPLIMQNRERIRYLSEKQDDQVTANNLVITRANGFLSRLRALSDLQREEKSVLWASVFILLLFITIEISPVLVKLISARGPYDELLQAEKKSLSFDAVRRVQQMQHELQLEQSDLQQKRSLIIAQNKQVMEKSMDEITVAKLEVNESRIKQWKENQLRKNGATVSEEFPHLLDSKSRPE